MRRLFSRKPLFLLISLFLYVSLGVWGYSRSPGYLAEETSFRIQSGESLYSISQRLQDKGLIPSAFLFRWKLMLMGQSGDLQAGDYAFASHQSPGQIADLILQGDCQYQQVTIPEGLTNHQVLAILKQQDFLEDDQPDMPMEGMLYPETYTMARGTKVSQVLEEMHAKAAEVLKDLWSKRKEGLPLKTPLDALVLASLVETEAYLDSEKPKIAGVYLARLRKNMRFQADPTVIYCVTNGTGDLGRSLKKSDMQCDSAHNTYVHKGLPPTPISGVSRRSLEAVLIHPEENGDLYFVADGKGGHRFSKRYHRHRRNINKLKHHKRRRKK